VTTAPAASPTVRGRRRREAVLDAAESLFLEHGFLGVSMDELGAAAGITGPGLYRHFPSKDALLMAVLDRLWAQLRPAVVQAAELSPEAALDALLDAHLDLALGRPAAVVLLVRELSHLPDDYRARAARNHRRYLDAWATALLARDPELPHAEAWAIALAVHGLLDSAAIQARAGGPAPADRRALLERLARAVLADARPGPQRR
jgi:AcrR family transcriptional regulator